MASFQSHFVVKILILVIVCLVGLQYFSLLQVNQKRRRHINRSLFTLDWDSGDDAASSDSSPGGLGRTGKRKKPLLSSIDKYLESVEVDSNNATAFLVPVIVNDNVTTASAAIISSTVAVPSNSSNGSSGANSSLLPLCPIIPPGLHGPHKVVMPDAVPDTMDGVTARLLSAGVTLEPGGRRRPDTCSPRHRVAVIVPYRDREEHLRTFLLNIHLFLSKQLSEYGVFVVEQAGTGPFNRAMLLNVGAAEALKQAGYGCFIFHDVDLLPEDDRNLYTCPQQPRHMSVAIDVFMYRLPYDDIFGGVSAMAVDHFRQVNGFSNMFWGWGGEDDDMSNRLRQKKLYISRYPANIARYKMLRHSKDKANPDRFKFLYTGAKRMSKDGYNSLKYKRAALELRPLFTWVLVDLPKKGS